MEFKKPEGFRYLSTLNPEYNSLEIELKEYESESSSNNDKHKELKNPFSLSGSKAKQLVIDPYARYKEVILGENPYFGDEAETRMLMGRILEDSIIYHLIKPKYENNSLWADKIIVIDKRRRYVKSMPWISYELDMLVYQLEKPLKDYEIDGSCEFETFYNNKNDKEIKSYLPGNFIINNTSGAYDEFLSKQIKYAVYDVKNSQLDVLENWNNYDTQINLYGYFENVSRVGLFVLVKNAKLDELVKNKDASIIKKIFNSYDEFIKGLEKGYTFEKEKYEGVCTELPLKVNEEHQQILNNIYDCFTMFSEYNLKFKKAEADLKLIKDYVKLNLSDITKQEQFNITIPLNSDGKEKISYYTTKKSIKDEIDTKELLKFFYNNDIIKVKTKDNKEIDFSLEKFFYKKITGGIPMFRLITKEHIEIDKKLQEKLKGEDFNV